MSQSITLPNMAEAPAEAPNNSGENLHQKCAVLKTPNFNSQEILKASPRIGYEAFFAKEKATNDWDDIEFSFEINFSPEEEEDGLRKEERAYKESFNTI